MPENEEKPETTEEQKAALNALVAQLPVKRFEAKRFGALVSPNMAEEPKSDGPADRG